MKLLSYFKDNIFNIFLEKIITLKKRIFFSQYIRMDCLRQQKYKYKQLRNSIL